MPEGYRHLTRDERCQIGALKESGLSDGAVAARLGRDRTTVWREMRRNGGDSGYSPGEAQGRAEARRGAASSNPRKMTPDRWARVEGLLAEGWSPEQVAGRLRLEGGWTVGRQWIYERVRADRKHPCLESSPDPAFFRLFPVFPGFRVRLSRTFPQRSPQAAPSGHAGNTRRGDPGRMAGDSLSAPDGRGPACRQAAAAVRSSHTRRSRRRALAVTTSLRMTATRATLWGFPLPLRRSYSSLMSGEHLLADSAAI